MEKINSIKKDEVRLEGILDEAKIVQPLPILSAVLHDDSGLQPKDKFKSDTCVYRED